MPHPPADSTFPPLSGTAEAGIDRTPHEMPNNCDGCGEARAQCAARRGAATAPAPAGSDAALLRPFVPAQYCLRGRWHCPACEEDFDLCSACYVASGQDTPEARAAWLHEHPRAAFVLLDDDDACDEAPLSSAGDVAMDADAGLPTRQLAAQFDADK